MEMLHRHIIHWQKPNTLPMKNSKPKDGSFSMNKILSVIIVLFVSITVFSCANDKSIEKPFAHPIVQSQKPQIKPVSHKSTTWDSFFDDFDNDEGDEQ